MSAVGRRLGRNLLWNTLQTWGSVGLTLASSVVYARLLQPDGWGVYSTFLWLVTTGTLLVVLGWNLTINKLVAEARGRDDRDTAARVFQAALLLELVGAAAIVAVGLAFAPALAASMGRPEVATAAPFIAAGVVFQATAQTATMGLIALEQYRAMSGVTLATSAAGLIAGLVWLLNGGGAAGLLLITATTNAVNAAATLRLLNREIPVFRPQRPDSRLLASMANYNFWSTLLLILLQVVYERAEVFFLSRSRSVEEVGYYSLAVAMTNLAIGVVPNVVIGPLLAMSAELHARGDRDGLRELFESSTRVLTLLAPPVGVGGALVALPIVELLYGTGYREVALAAAWLVPVGALLVVAKPANSLLWGLGEQRRMLWALVPGAILNLGLDALVIPAHGIAGAVAASSVAQIATTVGVTVVCLRRLGFGFPLAPLVKTTLAAALMLPFGLTVHAWLGGPALLVAQLAIGAVVYPLGLYALRALEPGDIALLDRLVSRLPSACRPAVSAVLARIARRSAAPVRPPVETAALNLATTGGQPDARP